MSRLQDVLIRGLRIDQPLPTEVSPGTVYVVIDEAFLQEQSDGAFWEQFGPTPGGGGGGGGLDQLTGDVLAGPGTGSQVATVQPSATAALTPFVGDAGAGGVKGLVPAPAAGDTAAGKFLKADGSFQIPPMPVARVRKVGCTVNNTAGVKGAIQIDFAGTILGWSVIADAPGTLSVSVSRTSSSPPPATPSIPNPTTDKISAAAPIQLIGGQSASIDSVPTWTAALSQWDVLQFSVDATPTIGSATLYLRIQET